MTDSGLKVFCVTILFPEILESILSASQNCLTVNTNMSTVFQTSVTLSSFTDHIYWRITVSGCRLAVRNATSVLCARQFSGGAASWRRIAPQSTPASRSTCAKNVARRWPVPLSWKSTREVTLVSPPEQFYNKESCVVLFRVSSSAVGVLAASCRAQLDFVPTGLPDSFAGEKPFKCDLCPKAFTINTKLQQHLRQHTGKMVLSLCCKRNTVLKQFSRLKWQLCAGQVLTVLVFFRRKAVCLWYLWSQVQPIVQQEAAHADTRRKGEVALRPWVDKGSFSVIHFAVFCQQ